MTKDQWSGDSAPVYNFKVILKQSVYIIVASEYSLPYIISTFHIGLGNADIAPLHSLW